MVNPVYRGQAELKADDDFLSHLLLDALGTAKNTKLGVHKCELPFVEPVINMKKVLKIIQTNIVRYDDMEGATAELLNLPLVQKYLEQKIKADRDPKKRLAEFRSHLRHYTLLYSYNTTADIGRTARYTHITGKTELAIFATKLINKGVTLTHCIRGSLAPLSRKEEDDMSGFDSNLYHIVPSTAVGASKLAGLQTASLKVKVLKKQGKTTKAPGEEPVPLGTGRAMRDFSVVWSTSAKRNELFLGPARFLNHDCRPNTALCRTDHGISFVIKKRIEPGEELTAFYGADYFGPKNEECLCASCENEGIGWYAKQTPEKLRELGFSVKEKGPEKDDGVRSTRSAKDHSLFPTIRFRSKNENGLEKGKAREKDKSFWFCDRCRGAKEEVENKWVCPRCIRHKKIFGKDWPCRPVFERRRPIKKVEVEVEAEAEVGVEVGLEADILTVAHRPVERQHSVDSDRWEGELDSGTDEIDPCLPSTFALNENLLIKRDAHSQQQKKPGSVPPDRNIPLPFYGKPPMFTEVIADYNRKLWQVEVTVEGRTAVVSREIAHWIHVDPILILAGLTKRNRNKVLASIPLLKKHPYAAAPGIYPKPPVWAGVWVPREMAVSLSKRFGVYVPLKNLLLDVPSFKKLCETVYDVQPTATAKASSSRRSIPNVRSDEEGMEANSVEAISISSDPDDDLPIPDWAKKYCLESDEEGEVGGLRKVKLERSGPSVSVSSGRQKPTSRKRVVRRIVSDESEETDEDSDEPIWNKGWSQQVPNEPLASDGVGGSNYIQLIGRPADRPVESDEEMASSASESTFARTNKTDACPGWTENVNGGPDTGFVLDHADFPPLPALGSASISNIARHVWKPHRRTPKRDRAASQSTLEPGSEDVQAIPTFLSGRPRPKKRSKTKSADPEEMYPAMRPVAPDPEYIFLTDSDDGEIELTFVDREIVCVDQGATADDPLILSD